MAMVITNITHPLPSSSSSSSSAVLLPRVSSRHSPPPPMSPLLAPHRRFNSLRLHSSSSSSSLRRLHPASRRLNIPRWKCWITNADAQFNHIATDEEQEQEQGLPEELPDVAANCPLPFVHINSNVIQSEPSNLLTPDTYIDSLLTTLPVLSEEEQDVLAATPAHPAGLYALYANCFAGNIVEHLWNFAWPAAIALIHPSLLPVAVVGFFTKLAIIFGGPTVGKLMDHFPRVPAYNCLSFIQAAAQLLSVAMIIYAHRAPPTAVSSVLVHPWFVVLVIAGAVERMSGLALGVAMERDWVVLVFVIPCSLKNGLQVSFSIIFCMICNLVSLVPQLAGTNRPIALAEANAVITRIDLLCEIAGSSLFGVLLSKNDPVTCLKLAAGLMMWAQPVVAFLTWSTNKLSSGVLDRAKSPHASFRTFADEHLPDSEIAVEIGLDAIKHGWMEYMCQPVLPASIAYVLLYFNVVLTPGGLMTAFLTQRGLNPSIIGGFSGLCAFMGISVTFVSADLVRRLGILKAGAFGLILQASLLTIAVAVYWSGSLSQQTPLFFFLSLIVLSRLGHMSYDVVGAQILQTGIPSSKANLIGTTEVSVASFAELVMLGVVIIANDVSHFGLLATLSLLSVVGAAWLFCRWLASPTDEQRSLFSFDPLF